MAMSELKRTENSVLEGREDVRIGVPRYFTRPGIDPFDAVEWETRTALIPGKDGPSFEQRDVEFPAFWSQTATNIVAQKYFRGKLNSPRARALGAADDRPRRRHRHRVGHQGRLLRRRRRGRDVPRRADAPAAAPDGGVQLAGLVQRRLRGAAAVPRLLHPLGRGLDGLDPRLDPQGGADLPRRLGLGHQPLASCAPRRSSCPRAATPPGRCRSCAAPTPRPARSSRAARRAGRPRWSS